MLKLHYHAKILICLTGLLCLPQKGFTQTLTEDRPLTFGDISISSNNVQREIELHPDGSYTADPGIYFYSDTPELGRYIITGQVPLTVMNITIDMSSSILGLGDPVFTAITPFTVPAVVTTDGVGNATFEIGATLRSNGSGINYPDANYNAVFVVTVSP